MGQFWDRVYDLAFKPKQTEGEAEGEGELEVREEAINVVREFLTTFSGTALFGALSFLRLLTLFFTPPPPEEIVLSVDDLEALVRFSSEKHSAAISHLTKVNIIRIMAAVAAGAVARHCSAPTSTSAAEPTTEPAVAAHLLERITTLLVASLRSPDADLVLRAEILDSLMDVYADDNQLTTELCRRMGLLGTLRTVAGEYRREVRSGFEVLFKLFL